MAKLTKKERKEASKRKIETPEIPMNVMSNDPTQQKYALLELFYRGAWEGSVGYMDALDLKTNEIVPILVGLELDTATMKFNTYPLARILKPEEAFAFVAPDGHGGYGTFESPTVAKELDVV